MYIKGILSGLLLGLLVLGSYGEGLGYHGQGKGVSADVHSSEIARVAVLSVKEYAHSVQESAQSVYRSLSAEEQGSRLLDSMFGDSTSTEPATASADTLGGEEIYYTPTLEDILERDFASYERKEVRKMIRHLIREGIDYGGGFQSDPSAKAPVYYRFPHLQSLHFNRVNGLFLGIGRDKIDWNPRSDLFSIPNVRLHGQLGYGTASKRWAYGLGAERLFGEKRRLLMGAEFYNALSTEDAWRSGLTENSITAFFAGYDFFDYTRQEGFGFYAVQKAGSMLEFSAAFQSEKVMSEARNTRFSLFGKKSSYRLNPPLDSSFDEIAVDRLSLALRWNPEYKLLSDYFSAGAAVQMEQTDLGASDDAARYQRYRADAAFFLHTGPGSLLSWRWMAGSHTGTGPQFTQFTLGGVGTLRGFGYKEFSGNRALLSNLEVKFGVPSGNRGWIEEAKTYLLIFLDSGWTSLYVPDSQVLPEAGEEQGLDSQPAGNSSAFDGFDAFKVGDLNHSAGFGLGSSSFRVELAWQLTGEKDGTSVMIRFNPTF